DPRLSREKRQGARGRGRHAEILRRRPSSGRTAAGLVMSRLFRAFMLSWHMRTAVAVVSICLALTIAAGAQSTQYTIKPLPPGGPAPRLSDGHPDLSGHWFPNGAGQGVSGRYGVDPAALGTFDPKATPEERPVFQPSALAKIQSMTATELELSKSSVNCMPR